ncbi:MAG: 3-dehydroquinate synthase [Candidatus Omnitrophica bacterium]|nr:3-dehydroquinate synthase [Candidatus Omnitrophota bacterium]MDD5488811.1 3-dehydroquinate synthase [Candidatus Omnitrophota bacterium]
MKKIKLDLSKKSYNIYIGKGVIKRLPAVLKATKGASPVVVISDKNVSAKTCGITGPVFEQISSDRDIIQITVPASEKAKSIKVYQDVVQRISVATRNHRPIIVALGGGVVGDLAGFIAATYRRGVPVVQVPTTLLAQVDSSIGGKTGIDIPQAKNIIGSFWQPKAVLMDQDLLRTLPLRQVKNGMGEIVKYAVIANTGLFDLLERRYMDVLGLEGGVLEKVIAECAAIKAGVVEKDEFDVKDIRIRLNFGHTLGHAVESASGYSGIYNHGESVALGMVLAGEISVRLGLMKRPEFYRIKELVGRIGLPLRLEGVDTEDVMKAYGYDKKFVAGSNRFVLPRRIGKVEVVEDIPEVLIRTVLGEYVE